MNILKRIFGRKDNLKRMYKCERCRKKFDELLEITIQNKTMHLCTLCHGDVLMDAMYSGKSERLNF